MKKYRTNSRKIAGYLIHNGFKGICIEQTEWKGKPSYVFEFEVNNDVRDAIAYIKGEMSKGRNIEYTQEEWNEISDLYWKEIREKFPRKR